MIFEDFELFLAIPSDFRHEKGVFLSKKALKPRKSHFYVFLGLFFEPQNPPEAEVEEWPRRYSAHVRVGFDSKLAWVRIPSRAIFYSLCEIINSYSRVFSRENAFLISNPTGRGEGAVIR